MATVNGGLVVEVTLYRATSLATWSDEPLPSEKHDFTCYLHRSGTKHVLDGAYSQKPTGLGRQVNGKRQRGADLGALAKALQKALANELGEEVRVEVGKVSL